ncbi:chromate transporter, partial [Clostridium sp.]|uniref:chromate transporter n=1 Tax=Clostridium sp. TaxID=1506 RepID=UPI003216EBB3
VEELQWLDESEMLDITAIAQSSPGPIPINASVILGYRMSGVLGSIISVIGTTLPPLIIISIISMFYQQFRDNTIVAIALQVMRAGVAAVIFDVVLNLAKNIVKTRNVMYIAMMFITFLMTYVFGISAMTVILICAGIGVINLIIDLRKDGNRI